MEIKALKKEEYAGRKFTVGYRSGGSFDIFACEDGFRMRYVPFETTVDRALDDVFFGEWLEEPVAFGAFEGGELIGFVEGSPERWNHRFRVSNICVFRSENRHSGIGSALLESIERTAVASGARMMVLETQSCNENAIAFYKKHGFTMIGFDLYAYSNHDPDRHEIRIEMGKKLKD